MVKRSMASIASGEPLPIVPPSDDPETDKWRRDVINYLRRLTGLFTDDNLPGGGSSTGQVDELNRTILSTESLFASGRWVLSQSAPFAYTVDTITHRATSTSLTLTFDFIVNGTVRTGTGDDSPSTVEGVWTPDNGSIAVGDLVEVNVAAQGVNGEYAVAFTLKRTRA